MKQKQKTVKKNAKLTEVRHNTRKTEKNHFILNLLKFVAATVLWISSQLQHSRNNSKPISLDYFNIYIEMLLLVLGNSKDTLADRIPHSDVLRTDRRINYCTQNEWILDIFQ